MKRAWRECGHEYGTTGGTIYCVHCKAEWDLLKLMLLREVTETLVYWHDHGHIDESWWDAAREALVP